MSTLRGKIQAERDWSGDQGVYTMSSLPKHHQAWKRWLGKQENTNRFRFRRLILSLKPFSPRRGSRRGTGPTMRRPERRDYQFWAHLLTSKRPFPLDNIFFFSYLLITRYNVVSKEHGEQKGTPFYMIQARISNLNVKWISKFKSKIFQHSNLRFDLTFEFRHSPF